MIVKYYIFLITISLFIYTNTHKTNAITCIILSLYSVMLTKVIRYLSQQVTYILLMYILGVANDDVSYTEKKTTTNRNKLEQSQGYFMDGE